MQTTSWLLGITYPQSIKRLGHLLAADCKSAGTPNGGKDISDATNFICGIMGICLRSHGEELQALSRIFLYPALTTMGFGIFIEAIWANVSWGNYWSWDSKETWALITFMIYAVVVHTQSLSVFRKPLVYHIYITLAFMSIAMTYFGVNYFLTGMHSYA